MNATASPLQNLTAKLEQLAVLPHVVFKVLELTEADCSAKDLERCILVDPGFSSKVLVIANSAAYSPSRRITSIHEASMLLGTKAIRGIALTAGVFDLFVGKTDKESLRRREWWKHSVDTATCAKWLARKSHSVSPDDAYTCGLLHLIGKTLLDKASDGDYDKVVSLVDQGVPAILVERKLFGCDHVEVGVSAVSKWGMPAEVASGINYSTPCTDESTAPALRATVAIAQRMVIRCTAETADPVVFPSWALERLGWVDADAEALIDDAREEIETKRA